MILNIQNSNTICFISNFNNVQEVPKQLARFQTPEREKHLDFPQNAFLEAWIHEQFEKKYMSCGIFNNYCVLLGGVYQIYVFLMNIEFTRCIFRKPHLNLVRQ